MRNQFQPYYQDLEDLNCRAIIELLDRDLEVIEQQLEGQTTRLCRARHIELDPTLKQILEVSNQQLYGFSLTGSYECRFMRYDPGDHYSNLHWDCLEDREENQRKLSFTLMLNDDYQGGEFHIVNQNIPAKTGRLIMFPSFMLHRVTEITEGQRFVIVGWLLGDPWQ